jgi:hypothetical protein
MEPDKTATPTQSGQAKLLDDARAAGYAQAEQDLTAKITAKVTADATAAERARIGAILGHAEAEGRSKLAQHIAFKTSSSVDDAVATLQMAAKDAPPAPSKPKDPLADAMANTPNPNVGASAGGGDDETEEKVAARILASVPRRAAAK